MEKLRDFQHTVTAVQKATLAPAPQAPLSAQEWEAVNSPEKSKGSVGVRTAGVHTPEPPGSPRGISAHSCLHLIF